MSGVRNLRAMFEQKGDGLPDRGRSPAPGGFATPSPSASPRPLSKVRTQFVAVEKDGRIGLQREPSRDSVSVSSRRLSDDTDSTAPQPMSDKSDVFSDNMASTVASFKTNLSHEAIPESPGQDTPAQLSPRKELTKSPLKPNANPDKVTDKEEPHTKMLTSNPTESSAARLGGTVLNGGISDALNGAPSTTVKVKASGAAKPAPKAVAPVSTAKTTARAQKSPLSAKATSPREPAKVAASASNPKKPVGTKTTAPKPATIDLPTSGTGFVKPKPKSPTRPIKLPASLTTHTTASAQKHGNGNAVPAPRRSLSRASGNAQHLSVSPATHRAPSQNSILPAVTTAAKTLKHRPSNANMVRSRPSLGPPPKQGAKEQPAAKKESQVDESFLARMTRPTQSSAKKTSEKAPVTPPRKQIVPTKRPDTKDVERSAKKVVAKMQASSAQAKTAKDALKPVGTSIQPTGTKEIAPVVAKVETAEEAIKVAKSSPTTTDAPLVKDENATVEAAIEDASVVVKPEAAVEDKVEIPQTPTDLPVNVDTTPTEEPVVAEALVIPEPEVIVEAEVTEPVIAPPVISKDPAEAADIEDITQATEEPSQELQSVESSAQVPEPEDKPETKEDATVSTKEVDAQVKEAVDEPPKSVEVVADSCATDSHEVETKGPTKVDVLVDGTHEDGNEDLTIKDVTTAAL
ncbi:hypothetical protein SAMD00023353_7700470 [Rosellinia necatrix]|uniref:Mucin-7 protein n=1 Tax=Rosellinia necatrix TaxID=77044 RepID=A0A1W2TU60_ROSNE|nr:hypothetical protein SAMD00023353_7700470 [Rosellinia necatrix]